MTKKKQSISENSPKLDIPAVAMTCDRSVPNVGRSGALETCRGVVADQDLILLAGHAKEVAKNET